jgi:hypothetical protein
MHMDVNEVCSRGVIGPREYVRFKYTAPTATDLGKNSRLELVLLSTAVDMNEIRIEPIGISERRFEPIASAEQRHSLTAHVLFPRSSRAEIEHGSFVPCL